jgi:hypothetical protein
MAGWRDVIDEGSNERLILEALDDSKWDYRTLEGLERTSGLTRESIKMILNKQQKFIRKSDIPDVKGRDLYTLKKDENETKEFLFRLKTYISKSI